MPWTRSCGALGRERGRRHSRGGGKGKGWRKGGEGKYRDREQEKLRPIPEGGALGGAAAVVAGREGRNERQGGGWWWWAGGEEERERDEGSKKGGMMRAVCLSPRQRTNQRFHPFFNFFSPLVVAPRLMEALRLDRNNGNRQSCAVQLALLGVCQVGSRFVRSFGHQPHEVAGCGRHNASNSSE
jgi:hypothetical protein